MKIDRRRVLAVLVAIPAVLVVAFAAASFFYGWTVTNLSEWSWPTVWTVWRWLVVFAAAVAVGYWSAATATALWRSR